MTREPFRILLATCNGAAHLPAQLDSYLAQDHRDWALWVSDDGSTDGTREILQRFRDANPEREIRLLDGPRRGLAAANFMALLTHPDLPAGPVTLSDQDDVWMPHRLSQCLAGVADTDRPALYGTTTIETGPDLTPLPRQKSALPPPSFSNALVQNIVAGNTATLNAAGLAGLRAAGNPDIPHHDWWLYLRLTGIGARVALGNRPVLYYRQHAGNVIGAHSGVRAGLQRASALFRGDYRDWVRTNLTALLAAPEGLLPEHAAAARTLLDTTPRLRALRLSGAQRAGPAGRLILPALALTRRI